MFVVDTLIATALVASQAQLSKCPLSTGPSLISDSSLPELIESSRATVQLIITER